MSNKVLKSQKISQFAIFVPDLNPVENSEFKFALNFNQPKEKEENNKEKEISIKEIKEVAKKEGYEEGYKKGYAKGFQKGLKEGEEKGLKEGFEKGYKEGEEKAKKEYEELKQTLEKTYQEKLVQVEKVLKSISSESKKLVLDLDNQVLRLAQKIAEKIVAKTIETDQETLIRIIKQALEYLAEGLEIKIKVNPEDYNLLKEKISYISKQPEKIVLTADKGITKGGALIETSLGVIDATIEKRWEKVLKALKNEG